MDDHLVPVINTTATVSTSNDRSRLLPTGFEGDLDQEDTNMEALAFLNGLENDLSHLKLSTVEKLSKHASRAVHHNGADAVHPERQAMLRSLQGAALDTPMTEILACGNGANAIPLGENAVIPAQDQGANATNHTRRSKKLKAAKAKSTKTKDLTPAASRSSISHEDFTLKIQVVYLKIDESLEDKLKEVVYHVVNTVDIPRRHIRPVPKKSLWRWLQSFVGMARVLRARDLDGARTKVVVSIKSGVISIGILPPGEHDGFPGMSLKTANKRVKACVQNQLNATNLRGRDHAKVVLEVEDRNARERTSEQGGLSVEVPGSSLSRRRPQLVTPLSTQGAEVNGGDRLDSKDAEMKDIAHKPMRLRSGTTIFHWDRH